MRKRIWLVVPIVVAIVVACVSLYSQGRGSAAAVAMPAGASFRIVVGIGDKKATPWDGSLTVSPGAIESIRGWRFAPEDSTDSVSTWKASTRRTQPNNPRNYGPMLDNGIIVTTRSEDNSSRFEVKTVQGNFSFRAAELGWGETKRFLGGRVQVDRVPVVTELTDSTDEQDYPAIAQSDDAVYVSYVEFVHANRAIEGMRALEEAPKSFDYLARPAGGDQVFLMRYSKADRT